MLVYTIDLMAGIGMALVAVFLICILATALWQGILRALKAHRNKSNKGEKR